MNNYIITSDATCDLPDEYISEHNIDIIPIYYTLDNETIYGDEIKLPPQEFYNKMREGMMPTTMAINPETATKHLRKHLEDGFDVLHISFSSGLSSSCDTSMLVANELAEEFPDRKIIVVDSKSATLGQGLLVCKAIENQKKGMNFEDNAKWLEEHVPHVCQQLTVDDLNHLYRGGRLSRTSAIVGTIISVKPIIHIDNDGKLASVNSVRGRKKSLNTLIDNMTENIKGFDNDTVFISHGDCYEDAKYVADQIKERFRIENAMINFASPVIGSHTGPGFLFVSYLAKER
ncbi:MAG: DegV family protein [Lachnospiraceae bacterium]|nr:DegV family protein [Lachnospiraceae bacterium]